jgi:hypothetical protein
MICGTIFAYDNEVHSHIQGIHARHLHFYVVIFNSVAFSPFYKVLVPTCLILSHTVISIGLYKKVKIDLYVHFKQVCNKSW